jgi:hypothetical protein
MRQNMPLNTSINFTCIVSTPSSKFQNPTTQHFLSPQEFKIEFKASPKLIKKTLPQAKILFPPPTQPIGTPPPQESTYAINTNNDNQHVGKQMYLITGIKTISNKDKWGSPSHKEILPTPMEHNPNHHR